MLTITIPLSGQWVQSNAYPVAGVHCFATGSDGTGGTNLFAGTDSGAFLSTNDGASWTAISNGLTNKYVRTLAMSGTNIIAGVTGGVFLSTNNGNSWTRVLPAVFVGPIAVNGSNLFASTYWEGGATGVYLSTNNGSRWTRVDTVLFPGGYTMALTISGTNLFAGTYRSGVFLSSNNGTSWGGVNDGFPPDEYHTYPSVNAFAVNGPHLFAGTRSGVFLSTNNGTTWTQGDSGLTNINVQSLAVCPNGTAGTNLFAGTYSGGVLLSTDNGTRWASVNSGLTNMCVYSLVISGMNLFAGTANGIWRRSLSEVITSVESFSTELPARFGLEQNYPNPFNPSTKIGFKIQVTAFTTLKVYDLLGREVATLVNEQLQPGSYHVTFDARGLASGGYFYRLHARPIEGGHAGDFVQARKLLLLR
jgi:hypothetical protein